MCFQFSKSSVVMCVCVCVQFEVPYQSYWLDSNVLYRRYGVAVVMAVDNPTVFWYVFCIIFSHWVCSMEECQPWSLPSLKIGSPPHAHINLHFVYACMYAMWGWQWPWFPPETGKMSLMLVRKCWNWKIANKHRAKLSLDRNAGIEEHKSKHVSCSLDWAVAIETIGQVSFRWCLRLLVRGRIPFCVYIFCVILCL